MGKVIVIANQKGGVGKTTTSVNLSACLGASGKNVLTIDIDPQGNTTSGLGIDKDGVEFSIYDALIDEVEIKQVIQKTEFENLWICPSNVDLAGAEVEMVTIKNREYTFPVIPKDPKTVDRRLLLQKKGKARRLCRVFFAGRDAYS